MTGRAKNILIVFLLLVIGGLLWILFTLSYGRYCTPIVREKEYPQKMEAPTVPQK